MNKNQVFRIYEGSLQERFQKSRAKIQIFGGGYANGKTANAVIRALQLAKDYPGSNGLIARATYPKLNDTIRKEFIKWCPHHWIKRFPKSSNSENTCFMSNGTEVNFRYVQQQGRSYENTTSNLLSATYDWIVVDQIDDPEFSFKDLLDLLGRLRGSTTYAGSDATMPTSGPRWIVLTSNPTRNWFYKKLIRPIHTYKATGRVSPELQQIMSAFSAPSLNGLIELFEGSTYENKDNLQADYISMLEALYTGQMRSRFLMGEWGAYEGLVYSQFQDASHVLPYEDVVEYIFKLHSQGFNIEMLEAYDHGIAVPACYLLAFVDPFGNIIICDGFYQRECTIETIINSVKSIRRKYLPIIPTKRVLADPAIFKRGSGDKKVVGATVASILNDHGMGIQTELGNNEIINGIIKVQGYLATQRFHKNPLTNEGPAPYLYVVDRLSWWIDEIDDYYWRRDSSGEYEDMPQDHDDHAMDATKYLLSRKPRITMFLSNAVRSKIRENAINNWHEQDAPSGSHKEHRYGRRTTA